MLWCHDFTVCDHLMNILSLLFFSFFSFSVYSVNEITTTFRRENTQSSAQRTVPRNLQGLICFWFCSQINVTPLYWLAWERGHSWCLAQFIFSLPFALFKLYVRVMHLPLKCFFVFSKLSKRKKNWSRTSTQYLYAIKVVMKISCENRLSNVSISAFQKV